LGVTTELIPNFATALGSNGAHQLEMTGAYAVIANGGLGVTPYGIQRVSDKDGQVLYERSPLATLPRVASARAISELTGMMEGVIDYGTGQGARLGTFAAGKTGTSQDYRDAWFSGFTQKYVATVWVGNDDNSSMRRVTGGSIPAQIWRETMVRALNDPSPAPDDLPAPDDSGFGGLLDRLLGGPTIEWNENTLGGTGEADGTIDASSGTPGTAYERMERPRYNN
jgi:penicillin-binding protein 1A